MSTTKHITISVPEKKYSFLMELLRNLDFIQVESDEAQKEKKTILTGLKEAVKEVKQHRKGKLKLKTAQEFLDEL